MSEAQWIPGIPSTPGFYGVKEKEKQHFRSIIQVFSQGEALMYWSIGCEEAEPIESIGEFYRLYYTPITFPA